MKTDSLSTFIRFYPIQPVGWMVNVSVDFVGLDICLPIEDNGPIGLPEKWTAKPDRSDRVKWAIHT